VFLAKQKIKEGALRSFKRSPVHLQQYSDEHGPVLSLPEADLRDPFNAAALMVLAFCVYPLNRGLTFRMIEYLKGSEILSEKERSSIVLALSGGKTYIPFSFFLGAVPENDYRPDIPYVLEIHDSMVTSGREGERALYVLSGGDPVMRNLIFQKGKGGVYTLVSQSILGDIAAPKQDNPWAF
jgi:hypothetical protein